MRNPGNHPHYGIAQEKKFIRRYMGRALNPPGIARIYASYGVIYGENFQKLFIEKY
jgi:hypothetical protein